MKDRASTPASSTTTLNDEQIKWLAAEHATGTLSMLAIVSDVLRIASQSVAAAPAAQAATLTEPEIIAAWNATEAGGMVGRYVRFAREIERAALQQRQAPAPTGDAQYFTAVFRVPKGWKPGPEIMESPYWSAGSWSHALDDRDAAIRRAEHAEAAPVASAEPIDPLPCPFCGAQATLLQRGIACDCCLGEMARGKGEDDVRLIASWNQRSVAQAAPVASQPAKDQQQEQESARLAAAPAGQHEAQVGGAGE